MLSEIYANRESAKFTGILDAFSLLLCFDNLIGKIIDL